MDCFCPQCWSFQNFRHNNDEVRDWTFLKRAITECRINVPSLLSQGLKGPVKNSEMQKISDNYFKNNKAPGPDSFQTELTESKQYRLSN